MNLLSSFCSFFNHKPPYGIVISAYNLSFINLFLHSFFLASSILSNCFSFLAFLNSILRCLKSWYCWLADSLAHFLIRDFFSGLRFFLHSEVLQLLFIIIALYVIILAFGFSLINLSSIPKFRSAILLIVFTLTVSSYNCSHGLAYLPSLRWSSKILLMKYTNF